MCIRDSSCPVQESCHIFRPYSVPEYAREHHGAIFPLPVSYTHLVKTAASATVTGVQAMARTPLLPTIKMEIITVTMPKQLRTTIPSHKLLWLIKNKIACLPIIYLLLTACHSNTVYHSYQSIPTTGWSKSDTLVYTLPASIPAGTYEMTIGIRHQESYPSVSYTHLDLPVLFYAFKYK